MAALALYLAASAPGAVAAPLQQRQAHLRVAAGAAVVPEALASDAAWKSAVGIALSNIWTRSPEDTAEPVAMQGSHKGNRTQGDKSERQPVSMQVPESEVNDFVKELSSSCGKRFTAMLHGKGPSLEAFGADGAGASSDSSQHEAKASCTALNGSICVTRAHVAQEKDVGAGRQMQSTVDVQGHGCLPRECVAKGDLQVLAAFMQLKAKETIPGMGVHVELRVNCTNSGGSTAAVGVATTASDGRPDHPKPSLHQSAAARSSAASVAGAAAALAATTSMY